MKKLSLFLAIAMAVTLLAGCAGTPVIYYTDCTCPVENHGTPAQTQPAAPPAAEGTLRTGLAIITSVSDSKTATADAVGEAKYDVTIVAVVVDENGVIQQCIIDSIGATVKFDASGVITSDVTAPILTKNELGEDYGMLAAGAVAEWDAQAAALANYAVGKTLDQLKNGDIQNGKAVEGSDLASSATIYLGGYVSAIEVAVNNAQPLGAQPGDVLKLGVIATADSSVSATADNAGTAQLDVNVTAITMNGDVITSCVIDAVQAKVTFDGSGALTGDVSAPVQTKNELGENYGMVAWGQAQFEWNEQAAAFASYVTGKTPAEVAGISVDERTAPVDADLSSSVTIAIGGFQALIQKAAQA